MADAWTCPHCRGPVATESKVSSTGWVVFLAGLLLAPVLVGLVLIPIGLSMKQRRAVCQRCRMIVAELAGEAGHAVVVHERPVTPVTQKQLRAATRRLVVCLALTVVLAGLGVLGWDSGGWVSTNDLSQMGDVAASLAALTGLLSAGLAVSRHQLVARQRRERPQPTA